MVDVGIVLDLETWVGQMSQACISLALSDFYAARCVLPKQGLLSTQGIPGKTFLALLLKKDSVRILSIYASAVNALDEVYGQFGTQVERLWL
ncbi:hypothetical protein ACLOJK_030601 [Asimina triloba]